MKTIIVDAADIMAQENPVLALARLYGLEIDSPDDLRAVLSSRTEVVLTEVIHWPQPQSQWEKIADLLEGIQQHSPSFYLIWGAQDEFVNTSARDHQDELEALPKDPEVQDNA